MDKKTYLKEWMLRNPGKRKEYQDRYVKNNPNFKTMVSEWRKKRRREQPWIRTYEGIYRRINGGKNGKYKQLRYASVKMMMNPTQIRDLWIRDSAFLMKNPSIDRINPEGDYSFDNCRYIEMTENRRNVRNPGPKPGCVYKDGRICNKRNIITP